MSVNIIESVKINSSRIDVFILQVKSHYVFKARETFTLTYYDIIAEVAF